MVVSQRLVRKLCPHCKKEDENYKEKLKSLNLTEEKYKDIKFYTSGGCEKCMGTGYIGEYLFWNNIFWWYLKRYVSTEKGNKTKF